MDCTISPLLFEMIVDELATGRSLLSITKEFGVSRRAVTRFRDQDEQRKRDYAEARSDGCDSIAERAQDITRGGEGSSGDVKRDKLIVETDLKLLACFDPKRYGTKIDITSDDGSMRPVSVADFYAAERARRVAGS